MTQLLRLVFSHAQQPSPLPSQPDLCESCLLWWARVYVRGVRPSLPTTFEHGSKSTKPVARWILVRASRHPSRAHVSEYAGSLGCPSCWHTYALLLLDRTAVLACSITELMREISRRNCQAQPVQTARCYCISAPGARLRIDSARRILPPRLESTGWRRAGAAHYNSVGQGQYITVPFRDIAVLRPFLFQRHNVNPDSRARRNYLGDLSLSLVDGRPTVRWTGHPAALKGSVVNPTTLVSSIASGPGHHPRQRHLRLGKVS